MPNRTCRRCGEQFPSGAVGRGKWQRFCSETCRAFRIPKTIAKACDVAGCEERARSDSAAHCEKHYYRLRRTGRIDVANPQRASKGICTVDGCSQADVGPQGLCAKHATRVKRHGDPLIVLHPGPKPGQLNPNWVGDAVKVKGAHMRVRAEHGPASTHVCIDCGRRAEHWSYNHTDPDEKQSDHGPYSPSIEHYSPRCVSCHKTFDIAQTEAARGQARRRG